MQGRWLARECDVCVSVSPPGCVPPVSERCRSARSRQQSCLRLPRQPMRRGRGGAGPRQHEQPGFDSTTNDDGGGHMPGAMCGVGCTHMGCCNAPHSSGPTHPHPPALCTTTLCLRTVVSPSWLRASLLLRVPASAASTPLVPLRDNAHGGPRPPPPNCSGPAGCKWLLCWQMPPAEPPCSTQRSMPVTHAHAMGPCSARMRPRRGKGIQRVAKVPRRYRGSTGVCVLQPRGAHHINIACMLEPPVHDVMR